MVAQGRVSARGGAPPQLQPPSWGAQRPRLASPPLHPRSRRRPQREPQETDAAMRRGHQPAPLLFRPEEERVCCRQKRLHAGEWGQPGGSGETSQNMSLLVIEPGVCHLSLSDLAKCM